ncbi:MAG: YdeI/OmpD-associated family protein [Anaerolineae bacterium]
MEERLTFADREAFRAWLAAQGAEAKGVWLAFGKDGCVPTLTANEALEEALCFGWIDGQIKRIDDALYLKWFAPRRRGSHWSERNRLLAEALIVQGRMASPGLAAIDEAKRTGIWDTPESGPITDEQIALLDQALQGAEPAYTNFCRMPASVRRTYTGLYLDAKKEETRVRRLATIIARLNENKRPM